MTMKRMKLCGAIGLLAASLSAADYVYLQKEPVLTASYPAESKAVEIVLSAGFAGVDVPEFNTYLSGVSREESNLSALDGTKPVGFPFILR